MSTSGSYSFSVSRDDIIRMSMLCIGKLDGDEGPTSREVSDCSLFLNALVKQWQSKQDFANGLKMWKRKRGELFLSNSTGQYSLGPSGDNWTNSYVSHTTTVAASAGATSLTVDAVTGSANGNYIGVEQDDGSLFWTTINGSPSGTTINLTTGLPTTSASGSMVFTYSTKAQRPLYIVTAVLRDDQNNDVPMSYMTVEDYELLPSKVNVQSIGDPTAIYYESQLTNGVLYTDTAATQDVTKHLHIVYIDQVQDFISATDNPDYPQQWFLALAWGLAEQIAPMFNAVWTDEMKTNAGKAIAMAQEGDPQTSTMFFMPGNDGSTSWMPGQYSR